MFLSRFQPGVGVAVGTLGWKTESVAVLCLLANPVPFLSLSITVLLAEHWYQSPSLVCEGLALSGDIYNLLSRDRSLELSLAEFRIVSM